MQYILDLQGEAASNEAGPVSPSGFSIAGCLSGYSLIC